MLFITAATVLAALFQVVVAQEFKINTLTGPVQCEPVQFTWEGGQPPFYLSLVPGGQPSAPAIQQFPVQSGNSFTWLINLPIGSTFSSSLKDKTGAQVFSDIQTVQAGPDNSCLSNSGSTSTPPATSITSVGSSAASTNMATTPSVGGSSRGTTTTSSGSGSLMSGSGTQIHAATSPASGTASSTANPSSSNAGSLQASAGAIGIAGLLGLAGAALLG